ncbi:MAG: hypothetical protein NWF05_04650 [Candidatus Bathyarchaeota archaeon]|nr:hypothetical protein [Candidatus Bathyarchaeota archaeon]
MQQGAQGRVSKTVYAVFFLTLLVAAVGLSPVAFASDSSFGNQSQGPYSATAFGGLYVSNFVSPADIGAITQIQVYLATGGTSVKAVIYSDNNGQPGALLAASDFVAVEGTSARWVSFDVSYAGTTPDTVYWLGVVFESAGTYYYTDVSGKTLYSASNTDAPNEFPEGTPNQLESLNVYAAYTPAYTSTPTPEDNPDPMQSTLLWVIIIGVIVAVAVAVAFVMLKRK